MTLHELLAALERIGEGDWQIHDVRSAEVAEGPGRSEIGAAPPGGRLSPTTMPRRPRRRRRKNAHKLVVKTWLRINELHYRASPRSRGMSRDLRSY